MGQKQSKITFPSPSIKIKDVTIPLKKTYIPPPKPVNKKDFRTSIGYIHDIVSIIPPLKLLTIGITGVADLSTNGKATKYIDGGKNYNHTIDFVPGGSLIQRIANDSSNGRSGEFTNRCTVDNIKLFVDNTTNIVTKKCISSDDIKKTFMESVLPPTTFDSFLF